MQTLESELKVLIVESLMLDDVDANSIQNEAPLFREGLGLYSIDALELAMAIDRRFGVKIAADDEANKAIFRTVASLAQHIAANRDVDRTAKESAS